MKRMLMAWIALVIPIGIGCQDADPKNDLNLQNNERSLESCTETFDFEIKPTSNAFTKVEVEIYEYPNFPPSTPTSVRQLTKIAAKHWDLVPPYTPPGPTRIQYRWILWIGTSPSYSPSTGYRVKDFCGGLPCLNPDGTPKPTTEICRVSAGNCDVAEYCNGVSGFCPSNVFAPITHLCRASAGDCDIAETCDGASADCPTDTFAPSTTTCRASAGNCDVAEMCTGTEPSCPANTFASNTTVCRNANGDCDVAETCSGSNANCPEDVLANSSVVCRPSIGECDLQETCSGSEPTCPVDTFASGNLCRDAKGLCDSAEFCNGTQALCPADLMLPSTTLCRASAGDCDLAENCDGITKDCPANGFASGNTCRPAVSECDAAEICNGSNADCPVDVKAPAGTVCGNPTSNVCNLVDSCDGSGTCLDNFVAAGTPCRAGEGDCDVADDCDGSGNCFDIVKPSTFECRAVASVCDVSEFCEGASKACPPDAFAPASQTCGTTTENLFCSGDLCGNDVMETVTHHNCSGVDANCLSSSETTVSEDCNPVAFCDLDTEGTPFCSECGYHCDDLVDPADTDSTDLMGECVGEEGQPCAEDSDPAFLPCVDTDNECSTDNICVEIPPDTDTGSDSDTDSDSDSDTGSCSNPETEALLAAWSLQEANRLAALNDLIEGRKSCTADHWYNPIAHAECFGDVDQVAVDAEIGYTAAINAAAAIHCGGLSDLIFFIEEGEDPIGIPYWYKVPNNFEDADSDSISNYREHELHQNPCSPQSDGCHDDVDNGSLLAKWLDGVAQKLPTCDLFGNCP